MLLALYIYIYIVLVTSRRKIKEEKNLYPTMQKSVFPRSRGLGLKIFLGDKPPDSQLPLTPYTCFIRYSFITTLSPSNTMFVKVVQCTFYVICALAFTSPHPQNGKISATGMTSISARSSLDRFQIRCTLYL